MELKVIELEEGLLHMERGVMKLKRILEGEPERAFEFEQYMQIYTTIYNMCIQKPPHDYSMQLYDKYRGLIQDYDKQTVLLSLKDKHDKYMLKELSRRWGNHNVLVRWLSQLRLSE